MEAEQAVKSKLIWLLIIHRHGDRSPFNIAPKDKYKDLKYWPEGYGNLNNEGRLRMYKLGQFIRRRYDHFLSDNIREIYCRSSDKDRCIESAAAVLAGMYPPGDRFRWNEELLWIPAPVHTVPTQDDYLLNFLGKKCREIRNSEIEKLQDSDAVKKMYEDSVQEREILEQELGYKFDKFTVFPAAYSTLKIEESYGLEMPSWYGHDFKQKLKHLAMQSFALGSGTLRLKQVMFGPLLEDIIARMKEAPVNRPDGGDLQSKLDQATNAPTENIDYKVVEYSTHDWTVIGLLEALNIKNPTTPGFGASLFFELYVDFNNRGEPVGEKYLKIFWLNDTETEVPAEKALPDCKLNSKGQLTLDNFVQYVGHILPKSAQV